MKGDFLKYNTLVLTSSEILTLYKHGEGGELDPLYHQVTKPTQRETRGWGLDYPYPLTRRAAQVKLGLNET